MLVSLLSPLLVPLCLWLTFPHFWLETLHVITPFSYFWWQAIACKSWPSLNNTYLKRCFLSQSYDTLLCLPLFSLRWLLTSIIVILCKFDLARTIHFTWVLFFFLCKIKTSLWQGHLIACQWILLHIESCIFSVH